MATFAEMLLRPQPAVPAESFARLGEARSAEILADPGRAAISSGLGLGGAFLEAMKRRRRVSEEQGVFSKITDVSIEEANLLGKLSAGSEEGRIAALKYLSERAKGRTKIFTPEDKPFLMGMGLSEKEADGLIRFHEGTAGLATSILQKPERALRLEQQSEKIRLDVIRQAISVVQEFAKLRSLTGKELEDFVRKTFPEIADDIIQRIKSSKAIPKKQEIIPTSPAGQFPPAFPPPPPPPQDRVSPSRRPLNIPLEFDIIEGTGGAIEIGK